MTGRSLVGGALLLGALGCTTFPVIDAGVCGNLVLDPGEACDGDYDDELLCRGPGEADECHYDCRPKPDGSQQLCPPDYGCARDGVCRVDRGTYEAEPRTISSDVTSWLSTTDFDGDGRLDLLSAEPGNLAQQGRFRIHYFDTGGEPKDTRPFPRATTRPLSRDVNDDGNADLVFSTGRVGMIPGRDDHEWLPASFSSYRIPNTVMRVLNVRRELVGLGTPLAALTQRGDKNGIFVPDYETARLEQTLELQRPVQELVGTPLAVNVFEGAASPCDELVLGYRGASGLLVVDLCQVVSQPGKPEVMWRDAPLQSFVKLPAGVEIDSGALAADANGDGHLDIIVGGTVLGVHTNFVAWGDGQQVEEFAHPLEIDFTPDFKSFEELELYRMPLAAGDVSGDGIADFVYPNVVLSSRRSLVDGRTTYFVSYENGGEPWTMAELGDLNANGFRDVVAATHDTAGITVVNCSPSYKYVGVGLPTEGPVLFITAGDFDGDLVHDVAYVERGKPSTEDSDFLAVAFGNALATPNAGRRIAAVADVQQLSYGVDQGLDALFIVTDEHVSGTRTGALTLFEGNPERLPLAPYTLVTFAADDRLDNAAALALMVGSFSKPGRSDVFAFGWQEDPRVKVGQPPKEVLSQWLVPDLAGAALAPYMLKAELPLDVQPLSETNGSKRLSLSGVAFDVDEDGLDEALWLLPEDEGEGCVLLVYGVEAGAEAGSAQLRDSIHFGEKCLAPEIRVLPLDAMSGAFRRSALAVLVGEPAELRLLWSDGSGRLSLDQSYLVAIGEEVRAFDLSPDQQRLAVVTPQSLYVVCSEAKCRAPDAGSSTSTHPQWDRITRVATLENGSGVAVLDPNLDKVPAIAVADDEGIRLFEALLK